MVYPLRSKIVLLCIGIFLLVSCVDSNKNAIPNSQIDNKTLKIVLSDPVETLDPIKILYNSDWQVSSMIYEGLIEFNSQTNSILPSIAKSWAKYENGKRWIFKIRSDKYFHDDPCFNEGIGRAVNAFDILYNFERIGNPNRNCYNSSLFVNKIKGMLEFQNGKANSISGINVIDSSTIEVTLNKNYITFLKVLATPFAYIVPKEAVDFYGDTFYKNPVGTGMFRLTKWSEREGLELVQNTHYQAITDLTESSSFNSIQVKTLSDPSMMISDILKNECQIISINNNTYNYLKTRDQLQNTCRLFVDSSTSTIRFFGFSMDNQTEIATNNKIRKAIAQQFKNNFSKNISTEYIHANSLLPQYYLKANNYKWFEKNVSINQKSIPPEISISASSEVKDVIELNNSIKTLGLKVNLEIKKVDYYRAIITDRPDIFRVSMCPTYPDPEEYYSLFYSEAGKSVNLTNYKNAEYDSIFEQSLIEESKPKRMELYYRLEEILRNDVPFIPISQSYYKYYIVKDNIRNFSLSYGIPNYKNISMGK